MEYPVLNFPAVRLRARRDAVGRTEVFDAVRGRWLLLTPEEWVRRHVVEFMVARCGFAPQQIIEEHPIAINGMAQRADIVAFGSESKPLVVVECKEPSIKIGQGTLSQVVRYNSVLGCRYIVITNGLDTFCYRFDGAQYCPIDHFPHYE